MSSRRNGIVHGNALKLGVFGANCSSGRTYAALPESWNASWENNVKLATLAESLGLECLIPIARWRGYGGASNPNGSSFESLAWAAGMLAATQRLTAFCTMHVPLHHPLVAAKQMATVDHIGAGRLGVNMVCGWNEDEFRMFGVSAREHDARYAQGKEWWEIIKRLWTRDEPFDFEGTYYQLSRVEGAPAPYGEDWPLMMNAGSSPAGRQFAIRYSDMHFDGVHMPEDSLERIADTKRAARGLGRDIKVWTPVGVVCRPSQREAEDYVQYVVDHADWGALGYLADSHARDARGRTDREGEFRRAGTGPIERRVLARGAYCTIGDPDRVAQEFARLQAVGFDGLALNFVDYLAELPYLAQEVLPRLERLRLRTPLR
jgi:alkanesulfonate monooxygenase SsuD/methylene tetrahydromethanopterin reductase-like flavin-dependent oxidoreductase (luciferase family)